MVYVYVWGPQFSVVRGISSRAAEFARFCRISTFPRNFAEFCNGRWIRVKCSIFWSGLGGHGKLITTCRHDCAIKYVTASRALT